MKWQNVVAGLLVSAAIVVVARGVLPELLSSEPALAPGDFGLQPLNVKEAPPFEVEKVEGGKLALADLKGHAVLLYFWATW